MKRQRGFTLLELIIVICIVAVMAGMLLSRIRMFQNQAEMAQMETVVGVLRSAISMKVGQLVVQGKSSELSKLATTNPMDLLAQQPANYLGELNLPQSGKISEGNWYFDRKLLLLVYIANTGATFQVPDSSRFVYRVVLIRDLSGANGANHTETSSRIEGVTLQRVQQSSQ